jgi:hypothetical protein
VIETIGAGEGIRTLDPNLGKVAVGAFYSPSVAVLPLGFAARSTGRRPISPAVDAPIGSEKDRPERSRSCSFDQRRRPETLRTAMAMAFFCPTKTTSAFRGCNGTGCLSKTMPMPHPNRGGRLPL